MLALARRVALALGFLALGGASARGVEDVPEVDREEFRRLWQIAPERMGSTASPLVMQASYLIRQHGEIWVDHEFTVGTDGVPSDYVFFGIEPPGVDPSPFRAQAMFFRYKPVEGQPPKGVRVRQRQHYYMPRPALPGED